jgi:divalent metal cation (Fe/Co/Zn/Cd) transporter
LGKIFSAIISKSLSIASSAIDSTIDLMLNFAIWWAARAIRKRNQFLYPQGLNREIIDLIKQNSLFFY